MPVKSAFVANKLGCLWIRFLGNPEENTLSLTAVSPARLLTVFRPCKPSFTSVWSPVEQIWVFSITGWSVSESQGITYCLLINISDHVRIRFWAFAYTLSHTPDKNPLCFKLSTYKIKLIPRKIFSSSTLHPNAQAVEGPMWARRTDLPQKRLL